MDIAVGIEEIKQGNNVTGEEDEKEEYWIVDELWSFTDSERNTLHVEIKDMCLNSEIKYFKKMSITKEQSDNLRKGNVVIMYPNPAKSNCQLKVKIANNSVQQIKYPSLLLLQRALDLGESLTLGQDKKFSSTISCPQ